MPLPDADLASRRLRTATAVLHQRVEDGVDLLQRAATLEGYVGLLRRFEAFYRAYEPALAGLSDVPRLARLRRDLDDLAPGWSPEREAPSPRFDTPAHTLGAFYVVEGASIGGQLIARFLHARHGLTPERGASFFGNGGEPVGPRWKAVRALLDAEPDFEEMVAGATATFLAFEATVAQEAALA